MCSASSRLRGSCSGSKFNVMATPNIHGHPKNSTALLKDAIAKELIKACDENFMDYSMNLREKCIDSINPDDRAFQTRICRIYIYSHPRSGLVRECNHFKTHLPYKRRKLTGMELGCVQGIYSEHQIRCLHLSNRCFRFCK